MTGIRLTNPHSVLAVLQHRPQDVLEVRANARNSSDAWKDVVALSKSQGLTVLPPAEKSRSSSRQRHDGGRIGTTYAIVREKKTSSLQDLFGDETSRGVWLALDQIQDPHNVGAIFRTAAFFGVRGIILTQDRSAPVTGTVYDIAAGGVETIPFTLQTNLSQAVKLAKKHDLWVLGSSEHAALPLQEIDVDRRWLLVVGNEEKGLRRLTLENCDQICTIPCHGDVTSLNVSVATGIMLSYLAR